MRRTAALHRELSKAATVDLKLQFGVFKNSWYIAEIKFLAPPNRARTVKSCDCHRGRDAGARGPQCVVVKW